MKFILAMCLTLASIFTGSYQVDVYATDSKTASGKNIVDDVMLKAYNSKYKELEAKYGAGCITDKTISKYDSISYLEGVSVVNFMDFNGDGTEDLFLLYSNGNSGNLQNFEIPTKNTYGFEVWTYENGKLVQLLSSDKISETYLYDVGGNYYLDFINIYENANGNPVIQLFEETETSEYYTNIYYDNGKVVYDEFELKEKVYTQPKVTSEVYYKNSDVVTQNEWLEGVAEYDKILLSAVLAAPTSSSESIKIYGLDYMETLNQTQEIVKYLGNKSYYPTIPKFHIAEDKYISLYLKQILLANILEDYADNHYYYLYDMDSDGLDELILYESSEGAGTHTDIYTVVDEKMFYCGNYGRADLLIDGKGGLIGYFTRMNGYTIDKISLVNNQALNYNLIASGAINSNQEYPTPEDFGYNDFEPMPTCPPKIAYNLYMNEY